MSPATRHSAHAILEHGRIFSDPLAVAILGVDEDDIVRRARQTPSSRRMRLFISIRTRFAEDALAAAYARGVRQLLVLGAGLDTGPYSATPPDGLKVFERDAGGERLSFTGFDPGLPTFVTCLGVIPYLTHPSIGSMLSGIARLQGGAEVVFDYSNPPDQIPAGRREQPPAATQAPEWGEDWLSCFDTDALHDQLHAIGFVQLDDLGPREIARRYLPAVAASVSAAGGHIVRAATA